MRYEKIPVIRRPDANISLTDSGKRCANHKAEEYASGDQRHSQGHWLGASAGTEGLYNNWAFEEGN
jgi:hypothetical protein